MEEAGQEILAGKARKEEDDKKKIVKILSSQKMCERDLKLS